MSTAEMEKRILLSLAPELEPKPNPEPISCFWSQCQPRACDPSECSCTCHETWRLANGVKRLT